MNEFIIEPGEVTVQWVVNVSGDMGTPVEIKPVDDHKRHGIMSINVTTNKVKNWFSILDGSEVMLGPVYLDNGFSKIFDRPIYNTPGNSLSIKTAADFLTSCVVEGVSGVIPPKATNPVPADIATNVSIDVELDWTSDPITTIHSVYMGTSGDSMSVYIPSTLEYNTTYYWRVDDSVGDYIATGDTWTFTTESETE